MALSVSVLLLSASLLCFEITLIRLLSISHWQPFVTLAISTALLGYGISGSVLARTREHAFQHIAVVYPLLAVAAALAYRPAAAATGALRLDPGLIIRDTGQWLEVALLIAVLTVPFILASAALALPLLEPATVGRFYGVNLAGAAMGVVVALAALSRLGPSHLTRVPAFLAALAAALSVLHFHRSGLRAILVLALAGSAALYPGAPWKYGPYKDISYALLLPSSAVGAEESGITGRHQVITAPALRSASGLSITYRGELPPQAALYRNGDRTGTLILSPAPDHPGNAYLRSQTAAAPYAAAGPGARVCLVGFSGGEEAARAFVHGAGSVVVIEPDRRTRQLVRKNPGLFRPWIFDPERTAMLPESARVHFLDGGAGYDLIVFPAGANLAAATAGLTGTAESFQMTVEGLASAAGRLAPGGMIAITGWNRHPPTGRWKVIALLRRLPGLAAAGTFGGRVLLVSGWSTHTFLVKMEPFGPGERERLDGFAAITGFSVTDADGFVTPQETANRDLAGLLVSDLDLAAPTDTRPYPWHSLRLSSLRRLLGANREAALGRVEWGFFFLVMVLTLSVLFAIPALFLTRPGSHTPGAGFTLYFACLGVGYMVTEILLIKRGGLVLAPPEATAGLVITSFLLFSGAGSLAAGRSAFRYRLPAAAFLLVPVLAGAAYLAIPLLLRLPGVLRFLALFLAPAPAAFAMGFPFPSALARHAGYREAAVPWAWAVTGYTSVIGSSLAGVLAVLNGFGSLLVLGAACYAAAGFLYPMAFQTAGASSGQENLDG